MARVGGNGTPEAVQAQDVILRDAGANPSGVAEVVRSMTGLEPSAAKELVARVPCAIRTRISPALAEALRLKLVAAGGSVEVRAHGAAPGAPERFDVFLQGQGPSKISVVRAVKMMTGLELREAVELVDEAPCLVKRRVDRDEAETIRHELVEAGAVVEIRAHDGTAPEPAPRASTPVSLPASAAASVAERPPSGLFEVLLRQCGPNKIAVIKAIRGATGLGLKEAKDLAESAGALVKRDLREHEAVAIMREFTAAGAVVDVREQGGAGASVELRAGADGAGAEDEPALVDVFLASYGANKIVVIKEVRALTGLGLKESKDLVEAAPRLIKEKVDRDTARQFQHLLGEVGAVVELRG